MKAKFVQLHHITYNGPAMPDRYPAFLHILQTRLLLALKEKQLIDSSQCTAALERLAGQTEKEKNV